MEGLAASSVVASSRVTAEMGTPDVEEGQELEPMESLDPDEEAMAQMMGFGGFNSTKVSITKPASNPPLVDRIIRGEK